MYYGSISQKRIFMHSAKNFYALSFKNLFLQIQYIKSQLNQILARNNNAWCLKPKKDHKLYSVSQKIWCHLNIGIFQKIQHK